MARRELSSADKAALVRAAMLDGVCIVGGGLAYLATGNWVWLLAGILLGSGFILPALIRIVRAGR